MHANRRLLLAAPLLAAACAEPAHVEREWTAFGATARAEVYATTAGAAEEIVDHVVAGVASVEGAMSTDVAASELNRLNARAASEAYHTDNRDLYRCIRLALDYAKASGGTYDPTLRPLTRLYEGRNAPDAAAIEAALADVGWREVVTEREAVAVRFRREGTALDLRGIVSGYALDVAARNFALVGSRSGLLRLGDHAYAWRSPPGAEHTRVALADPRDRAHSLGDLLLYSRGVAVAGPSVPPQGGVPLLDPATGRPAASDVVVAVAVADSAADADAVATALLVGGAQRGGKLLSETRRVEAVLLVRGPDGSRLLASVSLQERFEPSPELLRETGGEVRYLLPPPALQRLRRP